MKKIAYRQNVAKKKFFLSNLAQKSPKITQLLNIVSCAVADLIIVFLKEIKKNLKTLFHCTLFILIFGFFEWKKKSGLYCRFKFEF